MTVQQLKTQLTGAPVGLRGVIHQYGILVPLVADGDALSLLFQVRAATLRRQPLEVCFPGGRMEEGESPLVCAQREFSEELGIDASHLDIIAPLNTIYHRDNSLIHPFVGVISKEIYQQASPNPQEVDHLFLVPLSHLLTCPPEQYTYHWEAKAEPALFDALDITPNYFNRKDGVSVPLYHWEGHKIWGLTAHMVVDLVARLTPHQITPSGGTL